MRIFLVGFMGSGKTTIGKQLACRLGYQFIDQDEMIEKRFSKTINEVFVTFGEAKFREAERDALLQLTEMDNVVISTGGGAPCFNGNMDLMNCYGVTIYLKANPGILMHRLKDTSAHRPLIKDKSEAELMQYITEKLTEREPFYTQAKHIVSAMNLGVNDLMPFLCG
jgi:shikimate kinase